MALTKPKLTQVDTSVVQTSDPITVLNQGASSANVDVGFLFNRANGLVSNVALYWSESANSIVTSFTTNSGATNSNISSSGYANLTVGSVLLVNGQIYANGVPGTNGQFLKSTNTGMTWSDGSFLGGYVANQSTFGSNLVANSAATSTSTTTGALVIVGGAGISGDINVGGNVSQGSTGIVYSSSTTSSIGTGDTLIDSFSTSAYRSVKYVVSVTDVTNTQYQTSEILLVQDGTTATITNYGIVYTGVSERMSFSANIATGVVKLYGAGVSINNTVKLQKIAIPV